ncbi:hypothetical protein EVG20_g10992 [Dentipellis fragilis]|uniref:Uncharacterized protein n=1 Tax=Dentipellis fragilis TaxID=205917 RepID=A0A4Y9XN03_9AGAM|nr:hypothetical protein EVG20_g10992 [Dentipellis fragilis]
MQAAGPGAHAGDEVSAILSTRQAKASLISIKGKGAYSTHGGHGTNGAGGTVDAAEDACAADAAVAKDTIPIYSPPGTYTYIRTGLTYAHILLGAPYVVHELHSPPSTPSPSPSPLPQVLDSPSAPSISQAATSCSPQTATWPSAFASPELIVHAVSLPHSVLCIGYLDEGLHQWSVRLPAIALRNRLRRVCCRYVYGPFLPPLRLLTTVTAPGGMGVTFTCPLLLTWFSEWHVYLCPTSFRIAVFAATPLSGVTNR